MSGYRPRRVDANHRAVATALRRAGCAVLDVSALPGLGCDLFVGARGRWYVLEVKDGAKPPSARTLTPSEERLRDLAAALGLPYAVVLDERDALRAVGVEVAP